MSWSRIYKYMKNSESHLILATKALIVPVCICQTDHFSIQKHWNMLKIVSRFNGCIKNKTNFVCLWFHLFYLYLFAGRPFALQNCTVSNQSIDSIHVECIESFDGGLPQMFLLEMVEIPTLKLVRNLTLFVSINVTSFFSSFLLYGSVHMFQWSCLWYQLANI